MLSYRYRNNDSISMVHALISSEPVIPSQYRWADVEKCFRGAQNEMIFESIEYQSLYRNGCCSSLNDIYRFVTSLLSTMIAESRLKRDSCTQCATHNDQIVNLLSIHMATRNNPTRPQLNVWLSESRIFFLIRDSTQSYFAVLTGQLPCKSKKLNPSKKNQPKGENIF